MTHDTSSNETTTKRVQLIQDYVTLQQKLVSEAVSKLDPSATEYDFEESLPTTITIDNSTWTTIVHGLGVMFANLNTKTIVDVHIGFIDAPTAFDAWRLVQYCESLLGTNEDMKSWEKTLENLVREGVILPHEIHDRHYIMIKIGKCTKECC